MRNLEKTLQWVAKESPMDYCEEFEVMQSLFEYCDRHEIPFKRMHFRSGYESYIDSITERLQRMFWCRGLVTPGSFIPLPSKAQIHRKIVMFLMANTDVSYKYELSEDPMYAHVVGCCPQLPKFLTIALMWELQEHKTFYEMLSFAPSWFTFQYFEPALESLKYVKEPDEVIGKVEQLVRAIIMSLCRMERRKIDKVDKRIIANKLYDQTMNFLRMFYTPDAEKLKHLKKRQMYRYAGLALYHNLELVLYAFDVYESPELVEPGDVAIDIYEVCQQRCEKVPATTPLQHSDFIKEELRKIIAALMNSMQYNVMNVSMNMFLTWVEVEIRAERNLQQEIGERIYWVQERMRQNPAFAHDVEKQLPALAIKPPSLTDRLKVATIGDILRELEKPSEPREQKRPWLNELFTRSVAYGSDECRETMKENVDLMSVDNCMQIIEHLKLDQQLRAVDENSDGEMDSGNVDNWEGDIKNNELVWLIRRCLPHLSIEEIGQLLVFQNDIFYDNDFEWNVSNDIEARIMAYLNKALGHFEVQEYLAFCFEHAYMPWRLLFYFAVHRDGYIPLLCTALKTSLSFSLPYFRTVIETALNEAVDDKAECLPECMCALFFEVFIENKSEFCKLFMGTHINNWLKMYEFAKVVPFIKALNLITEHNETPTYKPHNFGDSTAPVLIIAAQIMDKARWKLHNYSVVRDELVRRCINFVQHTTKKYLPLASKKERLWIEDVTTAESQSFFTLFYFQNYALSADEEPVSFDAFVARTHFNSRAQETMFWVKTFVSCTAKEAEWLAQNPSFLSQINVVMMALSDAAGENLTSQVFGAFKNAICNYTNILRSIFIPKIEHETPELEKLIMKILKIANSCTPELFGTFLEDLMPLVMEIIAKLDAPLNSSFVKSVRAFVEGLRPSKEKEWFVKQFEEQVANKAQQ